MTQSKFLVGALACLFGVLLFSGCSSDNSDITLVKEGLMNGYQTTTVGKVLKATFDDPQWEAFEGKKGERIVQFTGAISQDLHTSVVNELRQILESGDEWGIQRDKYFQASFKKMGGKNSEYYQRLNKKYGCKLIEYPAPNLATICEGDRDTSRMKDRSYMNEVVNDFITTTLWIVGTPVQIQWLVIPDGSGFSVSYMGSDAWNDMTYEEILDAIYK